MAELVDAKYGENKTYEQQQEVMPAAVAQALPDPPAPTEMVQAPGGAAPAPPSPLGVFGGMTERPGEPVTSGSPLGPGPNSMAMGPQAPLQPQALSRTLAEYGAMDDSGVIAELATFLDGMNI